MADRASLSQMTTLAALAGGVLWAMATVFAVAFAPTPAAHRDVLRACVESVFALVSALIGGWFVAPWIVRNFRIDGVETITLIGLLVGLTFWQAVPIVRTAILTALPSLINRVLGKEVKP